MNMTFFFFFALPCLLSHTRSRRTYSSTSAVYFFQIQPFPSLDDRTVLTTIITWNTQYPPGKLQRDTGISLFPLSLLSFCPRSLPMLVQTQQSFMEHNKVQPQLTCHPSFSNLSFGESLCAQFTMKQQQKAKRHATDFSFVTTEGGLLPLLSCRELVLRLLLRAHQHDKDNW